jgi:hypothetical protein
LTLTARIAIVFDYGFLGWLRLLLPFLGDVLANGLPGQGEEVAVFPAVRVCSPSLEHRLDVFVLPLLLSAFRASLLTAEMADLLSEPVP